MLWESVELPFLWVYSARKGRVWSYRVTRSLYVTMLCPFYILVIHHFTLVAEQKVFKDNVWNIHSASPSLIVFIILKISYVKIFTMFLWLIIYLFDFFIFLLFHGNRGFQAYLPAKHYLAIFFHKQTSISMKIYLQPIYFSSAVSNNCQNALFICNKR